MLVILAIPFYLVSFVCGIIVLIEAFKDEIWKGIVSFLCGLYLLYYGLAEFDHEKKPLILLGWLGGGVIGALLVAMSGRS